MPAWRTCRQAPWSAPRACGARRRSWSAIRLSRCACCAATWRRASPSWRAAALARARRLERWSSRRARGSRGGRSRNAGREGRWRTASTRCRRNSFRSCMTLHGRGILITRPREQAQGLAKLVEAAGGRAIVFPAIEIQDVPLRTLAEFDLAIFVSPTAVNRALAAMKWPARAKAAALGRGTQRELERHGIKGIIAPDAGADSEALLAAPELQRVAGRRIVILRGEGGRSLLGDTLAARGAQVEYAECYRRVRPQTDSGPLLTAFAKGAVHAVTVSSAEGLENLLEMLGAAGRKHLKKTPLFVPHPRIAAEAKRLGLGEASVGGASDQEMFERLVAYFRHAK